jgi:hypothetical protein
MKTGAGAVLIFFGLFWSAMTLLFDVILFVPAARQIIAMQYPSTEGTILSSRVTHDDSGEEGTTYGVGIEYAFSVEGRQYTGSR